MGHVKGDGFGQHHAAEDVDFEVTTRPPGKLRRAAVTGDPVDEFPKTWQQRETVVRIDDIHVTDRVFQRFHHRIGIDLRPSVRRDHVDEGEAVATGRKIQPRRPCEMIGEGLIEILA